LRGIRDQALLHDGLHLIVVGTTDAVRTVVQTQAQLVELWQVKQPSVSQTLQQLIEAGAVEALPRRGREAIQYLMTGTARLAF
jgi:DNA-binding MarR family transcriptional regulator